MTHSSLNRFHRRSLSTIFVMLSAIFIGCGQKTGSTPTGTLNVAAAKAAIPVSLPPPENPVDVSPQRIVRFPIAVPYRDRLEDDYHDEDCGELLLHPASGRFVYRLWHDWPEAVSMIEELSEKLRLSESSYSEFLQGAAGFDGTRYWRVSHFPVRINNSNLGREAVLFRSLDEVHEHDFVINKNTSGEWNWSVAAPVHLVFAALEIEEFGRKPLHQALHGTPWLNKDDRGDWKISGGSVGEHVKFNSGWTFYIAEDNSEFGFS